MMKAKDYKKKIKEIILEENLLLPDFQRDFVWKPRDQQLKLACSLFLDIPIGSILVLDKLDDIGLRKLCYKKEIEKPGQGDSKLLMDGQQRVSTIKSIFSNLYNNNSDPSSWKTINDGLHNNLRYRWFLDLSLENLDTDDDLQQKLKLLYDFYWNKKFEDSDIEEIGSFIKTKPILVKNSEERWHPSQEIEKIKNYCEEENLLPLFLVLSDSSNLNPIIKKISEKYINFLIDKKENDPVKIHCDKIKQNFPFTIEEEKKSNIINKVDANIKDFFEEHIKYKEIYGVEYEKSQLNKAIVAFNTMNTGGVSLGVFDIVSAKYSNLNKGRLSKKLLKYAEEFIKKAKYEPSIENLIMEKFLKDDKNVITKSFSNMYLNILSLFIKEKEEIEGKEVKQDWIKQQLLFKRKANDIERSSKKAVESLILAFHFLIENCGVPSIKDIKYNLTILPIAYNLYKNKDDEKVKNKIEYSYWMSLFSGKYEKGQNAFSIEHLNYLIHFIKDSSKNEFTKYDKDLCNKRGYSDFHGFEAFYEKNSYSYSSNIGEYFLQFILSYSHKQDIDIFINSPDKKIKIEHFENLHKDHIIPASWMKTDEGEFPKSVHSILNKSYSPSKRNQERLNNPITDEVTEDGMKVLCIPKELQYKKPHFNSKKEKNLKDFLAKRFDLFKETIKKYMKDLESKWKD